MSDVPAQFTSAITATLVDSSASDSRVVQAARVSTVGASDELPGPQEAFGLINFLMENRHGSPFEHNSFTFLVEAPIFVSREFMRHRVGFSYNETSGRYRELPGLFYVPEVGREAVREEGTRVGDYCYRPDDRLMARFNGALKASCSMAWAEYELALKEGLVPEVARMLLPVNLMSSFYVTCNARSLMSFLTLRTDHPEATFPSKPQREIAVVGDQLEAFLKEAMPLTYGAYILNGRVAP